MTWLANWNYRKPITISNTGSELTDYQVLVTVNTATLIPSKMRSDCGDIRFTSSSSSTPLNYWIESGPNTTSTKIWIKIPSISNGSNTIYIYYGNSSAMTESNGANTFPVLFSDFSSSTLTPEWTINSIQCHSAGISSSTYHNPPYAGYIHVGPGCSNGNSLVPNPSTTEMVYKQVTLPDTGLLFEYWGAKPIGNYWDEGFQAFIYSNGTYAILDNWCLSYGSIQTCGWTLRQVDISAYKNQTVLLGFYGTNWNGQPDHQRTVYFDGVRSRTYTSPEPTFETIGTEETPPNITATSITITPSENPCAEGSCTIMVSVIWTNTGGASGSFTPSITVDGDQVIIVPPLIPVTIVPSETALQQFTITGLTVGQHTICPDPN